MVADTADSEHQRIVAKLARRNDLFASVTVGRPDMHQALFAIETGHFAQTKAKMPIGRLRQIFDFVLMRIQRARGHFVQQGFPHVGSAAVDECDRGLAGFTQLFPQHGRQRQTAGAATNDHDAMRFGRYLIHDYAPEIADESY